MGTDSSGYTSGDSSVPPPIGHVPALRTLIATAIGVLAFLLQIKIGTGFPDDLDSSWQQVLAWAITHHVQWGRDLVFTYGPLGFMNPSTAFDPATYWAVLSLQLVLAGAVALLVITALRKLPTPCVIVFAAATIILGWSWSTNSGLLIAFPLAAMSLEPISRATDTSMLSRYAAVTALAAFVATLPLIKFSMFPLWCVWLPLGLLVLWRSGRPLLSLAFVLASVLAPVVTWIACGQHLTNFGAWLTSSLQMARYYASAMQSPPLSSLTDWVTLAATAYWLIVLMLLLWGSRRSLRRAAVYAMFAATLVLSYKAGIIRGMDGGHVMLIVSTCTLSGPLLAGLWYQSDTDKAPRASLAAFMLACIALPLMWLTGSYPTFSLEQSYSGAYTRTYVAQQIQFLLHPLDAYSTRLAQWQHDRTELALPLIKHTVGHGSVDILTNDQSVLLANNLNYHPRPVFQSYSAYSGDLARLNAAFFQSDRAPQWVILNWHTLGPDYPTGEDSRALIRVLQRYRPVLAEGNYLLLRRGAGKARATVDAQPALTLPLHFNKATPIPAPTTDAWFAKFDVALGRFGTVDSLLFREPRLTIEVGFSDGTFKSYTLARDIARSGFMLSPALDSNTDYLLWLQGDQKRYVTSLQLVQQKAFNHPAFKVLGSLRLYHLSIPRGSSRTPALYGGIYPGFSEIPSSVSGDMRVYDVDGKPVLFLGAPAHMSFDLPTGTYVVTARFGIMPNALTNPGCIAARADGIGFNTTAPGATPTSESSVYLDPFDDPKRRYAATFSRTITVGADRKAVVSITEGPSGSNGSCDWAWVRDLKFAPSSGPPG